MKTMFTSIIAAALVSNTALAGAGTLFRDDIGVSNWPFASSQSAKNDSLKQPAKTTRQIGDRGQSRSKQKHTDQRLTTR